jgi:hypothetical protein
MLTVVDNVVISIAPLLLDGGEGFSAAALLGNATILLFPCFST